MFDNIKIATKDTFIYSLGNISTKLIGLVLLPLYTKVLSVEEYGVLGTVEITIQLLIAAFSLSLQKAMNRWYWDKNYRDKQKSIFFTTFMFLIGGALLMILIFIPFSGDFSNVLLDSSKYKYLFDLMLISAALQIITRLLLALMRIQRKPLLFTTTNVTQFAVILGFTVYFVAVLERGLEGIFEAQILGYLFFILINIRLIINSIKPVFERSILKEMLRFSYPLVFSTMTGVIMSVTDRYAVRYIGGLNDMGVYTLGFKITNILKVFVINSVVSALLPLKFQMMDKPNNKRFYSKIMTYTAFGFIIILLFLALYSQEVIKLLAQKQEFWRAYQIVPILGFAQLFVLLRRNSNFGLMVKKKTKIISYITISVSILNLGLSILLVYYFRSMGAATASLLSQSLFFLLTYFQAQKHYHIPYELKKIFTMVLTGAAIVIISFLLVNPMALLPRIILKFALIVLFPVILYFFNFYESIELDRLRGAWHKWKNPNKWRENLKQIKIK